MRTLDFDYSLPLELIAQAPAPRREQARLLVLDRRTGQVAHQGFGDLAEHLRAGDVLVMNDSRVMAARLRGTKAGSGGQIELLLLTGEAVNDWWVLLRPGKRVRPGTVVELNRLDGSRSAISATIIDKNAEGHCRVRFTGTRNILDDLVDHGELPLPPYIVRDAGETSAVDQERYQTVYARAQGSVAAPTAGLHYTPELLARISGLGVKVCFVTLHVGLGTFAPVKADRLEEHVMHTERFSLSRETADAVNAAKDSGGRVIAAGTTSTRVLESVARAHGGRLREMDGETNIFIHPPQQFQIVDALQTNFHLPQSTLLMLVSAFAAPAETRGRELILSAYEQAIQARYRFFSYGDTMLIL